MTTSGTYSFSVNRDQVIRMALLILGKIDENETPSAALNSDMAMMLNMIVKQWMGHADFSPGLKTWTRRHGFLFLSGITGKYNVGPTATGWTNNFISTTTTATIAQGSSIVPVASAAGMTVGDNIGITVGNSYIYWTTVSQINGLNVTVAGTMPSPISLGATVYDYTTTAQQPLELETVFLRDSSGNDTPIKMLTLQQYDALPSKASPTYISDPAQIYYEWQLTNSQLYTDVAGSADLTKYICTTYLEEIQDFNNPADTPEYPQEYYLALSYGLAKFSAPMLNAVWSPVMEENFKTAVSVAQNKAPSEVTVHYFQPYDYLL